eukprot:CAMPEP_0115538796 /NCGR_PEP_ID=MMETSP0271-20121206/89065_1 /TAXON_ID=71861 /ORGANISM="Scrippsiella trochoidea, Strain CCMP3099" /LENGTH=58 /DNA_ID=CAMNT_0002971707 /DNA_START=144 /DNA_END=318 /DNA_ORIENTATION=-
MPISAASGKATTAREASNAINAMSGPSDKSKTSAPACSLQGRGGKPRIAVRTARRKAK